MSVKKFAGVTASAAAAAVVVAPFYAAGVVVSDVVRFCYRHPRTTALAMAAGIWWYTASDCSEWLRNDVKHGAAQAVEYVHSIRASSLEQKLTEANAQQQQTQAQLRAQQAYAAKLEAERKDAIDANQEWQAYASQLEVKVNAAQAVQRATQQVGIIENPEFNAYYTNIGETVQGIAAKVTGSADNYRMILEDNNFRERDVVPGRLLWVRKSHTVPGAPGVYSRVPALKPVLLDPGTSITEHFGPDQAKIQETLILNRKLGLNYDERSKDGYRFVYVF